MARCIFCKQEGADRYHALDGAPAHTGCLVDLMREFAEVEAERLDTLEHDE